MDSSFDKKIENRIANNQLRSLKVFSSSIDFFSNDYLGLSNVPIKILSRKGSTGSRLLSGTTELSLEVEISLASFFDADEALLFNSGYTANLGVYSCIPQRGETIVYDEYVHASIRDGIRLSHADAMSFKHNDLEDLEKKLKKTKGNSYIAVESLYSMEGDMAPLRGILELAEKFGARVIVDEAHSVGVFGENGKGIVHGRAMQDRVFIRVVTFGKAYGYHGAAVLCSDKTKQYLVNFSRPFIYTTAPSEDFYQRVQSLVKRKDIYSRQKSLHENLTYFREHTSSLLISEPNSPIQVYRGVSVEQLRHLATRCTEQGIFTKPIFTPTVPAGKECLRFCFHAFNTREEIDTLKNILFS